MHRREFLRTGMGTLAAGAILRHSTSSAYGALRGYEGAASEQTRRILYVLSEFAVGSPSSMRNVVETIGGSSFNVVILSFLQASLSNGKLTLLYNGNEFSRLDKGISALLARLRSGFGQQKRLMISVGGWQHVATFEAIRSFGVVKFVRQLVDEVIEPWGLGGIDLDLEPQVGGLDQWMAVHHEYGELLAELTNEYKRVRPNYLVTHAPLSAVAAEIYVKPTPVAGLKNGLLAATRTKRGNNIDWLNVQFYEGGVVNGGEIPGYYRDSLTIPLMKMKGQSGVEKPLPFLAPLFQPQAKQPLEFCRQTIAAINQQCASLHAGRVNGVAIWDYKQVSSAIHEWSIGLESALIHDRQ